MLPGWILSLSIASVIAIVFVIAACRAAGIADATRASQHHQRRTYSYLRT